LQSDDHCLQARMSSDDEVVDLVSEEERPAQGKQPASTSRPTRRAAQVAGERMQQQGRRNPAAGSDEEEESDASGGEEASGSSDAEGASVPVAPLSEYEVERQHNMHANKAELHRLGLDSAKAKRPRPAAKGPVRKPTARPSPGAGPSGASPSSSTDEEEEEEDLSDSDPDSVPSAGPARKGGRTVQRRSSGEPLRSPASSAASDAAADAAALGLFEVLTGKSGKGSLLRREDIRRVSQEMRLDIPHEYLEEMIVVFDEGGKGGLTFREFASVVQQSGGLKAV